MPWWVWVTSGLALLCLEMFVIDTGFYLVFLGLSASLVGLCALAVLLAVGSSSPALEWPLFGAFSLVSLLGFRGKVYARLRRTDREMPEGTTGEWATASERIEPGGQGRVELRGAPWSARNIGTAAIERGGRAQVVRAESLLLLIQAESH